MGTITVESIKNTDILSNQTPRNWYKKEEIYTAHGQAVVDGHIQIAVMAKWYMGRSSRSSVVYCAVSISNNELHTHGHGSAGGDGYDKCSAALSEALENAQVRLSECIAGTGQSREAIEAVTKFLHSEATDITVTGAP